MSGFKRTRSKRPSVLLDRAADHVELYGIRSGSFGSLEGPTCLMGSVLAASADVPDVDSCRTRRPTSDPIRQAWDELANTLVEDGARPSKGVREDSLFWTIANVNDSRVNYSRPAAQKWAVETLRKAARRARQAERKKA